MSPRGISLLALRLRDQHPLDLRTPDGEIAASATSLWARRDGEWKTAFQQATTIP